MDISNIIGSAVVVTQQTSQQINPQQDQATATGATVGDSPSAQQQVNGTQNAANARDATQNNGENAASNDDAKGSDNDKDNSPAAAAPSHANGIGANLNITA